MEELSAVVLAGGKGSRMGMLCQVRAKPVLPFAGGFKVIDFTLSNCLNSGVTDITVLADYQKKSLREYLDHSHFAERCPGSFCIREPRSGSYLGTADAVFQNLHTLGQRDSAPILVLAGDHVYRMDYRKMLEFHRQKQADLTVGVVSVPLSEASRFGIMKTDGDGRVRQFVEKPKTPEGTMASMGIYLFNPDALARVLKEDALRPHSTHDFGHSIVPGMVDRFQVFAYEFTGYWQDIGTLEAYLGANLELNRESPALCLNGGWPIISARDLALHTEEPQPGLVQSSKVSPGCVIEGLVENSILSPGVRVEKQAIVRNSIIMAGTVVGWHSIVDSCIVDEDVKVGRSCYLGFGSSRAFGSRGITVVGKGVHVPDFTAVDRDCRIGPYSSPSDFTTRAVLAGTVMVAK